MGCHNSAMPPKERSFRVNHVAKFLKTLKNTAIFPIQQTSIKGHPDYLACINGRFCGIELKRSDKDHPTKLQAYIGACIKQAGGVFIVATPEGWEECKQTLKLLSEDKYD